jgi:hypothetical protein
MLRTKRGGSCALVCAIAVVFTALTPTVARGAEPPTAVLEFERDEGTTCPLEGEFRQSVAERMGYDPFRSGATRVLSIHVRGRGPYQGELVLRDAGGHEVGRRVLQDADCGALRDSLVLAVTLGLDPLALMRAPAPVPIPPQRAPEPAAPPPSSPTPTYADERAPAVTSEPAKPLQLRVSLGAALFVGVVPGDVPGPSGSIGLRYGRFGVDVEGATTLSGTSGGADTGGAQGSATIATLLPCYRVWSSGRARVDLCGAFTGGALFSRGTDVSRSNSRTDPLFLAGLRAHAEFRFTRALGVAIFAQGSIPLEHDELSVDVAGAPAVVWKSPSASLTSGLSLFALIP